VSGPAPSPGLFVESKGFGWYYPRDMAEDRLRPHLDVYLGKAKVGIYCVLAALLLLTALATMGERGQAALGSSQSRRDCGPDAAGVGCVARRLDAGGDSAYRQDFHSFARAGHGTVLGDRLDCLNSADAGDKPGHPHQTRGMVDRGREPFFALL